MRKVSTVPDMLLVDIEGELKTGPNLTPTKDGEEITSQRLRINDVASTKTEVEYDVSKRDGVEQAILSSCGETMAKDKADDLRVVNTTMSSRVEEGFRTRLFETSGDEEVSI